MDYLILKRVAMIVLITFFSMVLAPFDLIGDQTNSGTGDLELAKQFFEEGTYDKSIELLGKFIEQNKQNKASNKELIEAYYYQAKIYFNSEENENMVNALKNLFQIDPKYNFPGKNNSDFLKRTNEIRKDIENKVENEKRIEKVKLEKKRKKFPLLVLLGSVVVVSAIVYLLTKKPKENTLTVTIGDGAEGDPLTGTHSYKKDASVSYSYRLKSGYVGLSVTIDGIEVAPSGTVKMNTNHTITATASKTYTLTVNKGTGVYGNPDTGTTSHQDGETVSYDYSLQSGYTDLVVTLDGIETPAKGTIIMNKNHTLSASAGKTYTFLVTKGEGIIGIPDSGTYSYKEGYTVNYGYTLQNGYSNLIVLLDGVQVVSSGTITMDKNYILIASAGKQFKLDVIKGTGVDGTPNTGTYTYNQGDTVVYNFSLKSNYKNLKVTLDGSPVASSGTFIMNGDRNLNASAEPL